jgi:hypothetical protein
MNITKTLTGLPLIGRVMKFFPIEAIIIQGYNNYTLKHDKMRRVTDKDSGHEYYTFWQSKGEYKPVPYDKIIPSDKGLSAILFSPASGQYFLTDIVMDMEEKELVVASFENNKLVEKKVKQRVPVIKPINESIRQTASVIHHRLDIRYPRGQTWFEKYGLVIYIILWAMAICIPMIFYPAYLAAVTDKANGVAQQIGQLMNSLGIAAQQVSNTAGAVKPPV